MRGCGAERIRSGAFPSDRVLRSIGEELQALVVSGGPSAHTRIELLAGLAALTLASDGAQPTWHALTHMSLAGLVCMLLLGGVSTILGPVVGALVLTSLPHLIELPAEMRVAVYGMILILVILLMPRGIVGLAAGLLKGRAHAA